MRFRKTRDSLKVRFIKTRLSTSNFRERERNKVI